MEKWVLFACASLMLSAAKASQIAKEDKCSGPNAPNEERQGTVELTGYLYMNWTDEFRVWSHSFPHNCIEYLVIHGSDVWLPDVAQINSDERYLLLRRQGEYVRLHQDGQISYSPGGTFFIFCHFDLTMFPFDTQRCFFSLESWKTTTRHLIFGESIISTDEYFENEQWSLVATGAKQHLRSYTAPQQVLPDKVLQYGHVDYIIVLKRKVTYYVMDVIFPSVLLGVAFLATFLMPFGSPEKMDMSFTCLLAYSLFKTMVNETMPRSSDHIPLLVIYLNLQMALIAFSMLGIGVTFLALEEAAKEPVYQRKLPKWLLGTVTCLGEILCLKKDGHSASKVSQLESYEEPNDQMHEDLAGCPSIRSRNRKYSTKTVFTVRTVASSLESTEQSKEWILLGRTIDRAVAVLYTFSLVIATALMLVVIPSIARGNGFEGLTPHFSER